jgi:hypothetical protein
VAAIWTRDACHAHQQGSASKRVMPTASSNGGASFLLLEARRVSGGDFSLHPAADGVLTFAARHGGSRKILQAERASCLVVVMMRAKHGQRGHGLSYVVPSGLVSSPTGW